MNVYDEYLKKEGLKIPHEGDVEGTVAAEMRNDAIERIFYGKTATAATADEEADWYGMLLKAEEIREKSEEEAQWYREFASGLLIIESVISFSVLYVWTVPEHSEAIARLLNYANALILLLFSVIAFMRVKKNKVETPDGDSIKKEERRTRK